MKTYVGVKQVQATPIDKNGEPGYLVIYEDNYKSWCPKDVFDKAYFELEAADRVSYEDVQRFIIDKESDKLSEKTTWVCAYLLNGFEEHAMSSCINPANYDHEIGVRACVSDIVDRVWSNLGFVVAWAKHGLGNLREGPK
jgi:hypothetical protein